MPTAIDAQAAYQKHLPDALVLPDAAILPYRLDPDLVTANVNTAMAALLAKKAEIPTHLPKVDLAALLSLPELAAALQFAALKAETEAPSEQTVSMRLAEARDSRRKLLAVAKGLAATGLVPHMEVDAIVTGSGARDIAEDCVSLADLFRTHAAKIAGNHPITIEQVDSCAAVGSWLLSNMRPLNAPSEKALGPSENVHNRNRLATLLASRYETLRKVVHYFHGESYEELAPPMMSRKVTRAKSPAPEAGQGAP